MRDQVQRGAKVHTGNLLASVLTSVVVAVSYSKQVYKDKEGFAAVIV